MESRARLKGLSKEELLKNGNWKIPALLTLLTVIISAYIEKIGEKYLGASIGSGAIVGIINIFSINLYLKIAKTNGDKKITFNDLKVPLNRFFKCIIFSVYLIIIIFIVIFLLVLISGFLFMVDPTVAILGFILATLVSAIISIYTTFSMSLILDKDVSIGESISLSLKLVKGDFWPIIVLGLSFILWFILSAVTFGIAGLWVLPYVGVTYANCYKDLYNKKISKEL